MARFITTTAAAVLLASCAAAPTSDPRVADLSARIEQARADPKVTGYSNAEVEKAQHSLDQARRAEASGDRFALDHDVAMGQYQIATAVAQANSAALRNQRAAVVEERLPERQEAAALQERVYGLQQRQPQPPHALILADVPFDTGQATLKPAAERQLRVLAAQLKDHPQSTVKIQGFADQVGSAGYNQRLSEARARSVKSYLVARGIAPDRIATQGLGESLPLASNATPAGRRENRRAEVLLSEAP